jgi:glycosyltransferase involved in cell wall biosynthesis
MVKMMFRYIADIVTGPLRLGKRSLMRYWRRIFPERQYNLLTGGEFRMARGRALVSYVVGSFLRQTGEETRAPHSNTWECSEIVRLLNQRGFLVDATDWEDSKLDQSTKYDLIFDIHRRLGLYSQSCAKLLLHSTGSYPRFSNMEEEKRLRALTDRRGVRLCPRRSCSSMDLDAFDASLSTAHRVTLIGNGVTSATYPEVYRSKINTMTATGSYLPQIRDLRTFKRSPHFLWYNGSGAVHKGLDVLLELFDRRRDWVLHVVGPCTLEMDFVVEYRRELYLTSNIRYHGFQYPASDKFAQIASSVIAFINPTCSEGMSTSSITCMQFGVLPVLSAYAGIDLSGTPGYILPGCTSMEIEETIERILSNDANELEEMTREMQLYAASMYSHSRFSTSMGTAIDKLLSM